MRWDVCFHCRHGKRQFFFFQNMRSIGPSTVPLFTMSRDEETARQGKYRNLNFVPIDKPPDAVQQVTYSTSSPHKTDNCNGPHKKIQGCKVDRVNCGTPRPCCQIRKKQPGLQICPQANAQCQRKSSKFPLSCVRLEPQ